MIEAEQLSKTFRVPKKLPGLKGSLRALFRRESVEREAVKSATFHVGEGEIVGLVGANGAGKTTLVKMLAGIIHPTAGTARVLGHVPWRRENGLRRQMALIMGQKAQLWWDLPAADCFLLLKEIYQLAEPVFRANLDYLTEVLGVRDQLHVQIRRLSLGERMKMELIAALLHGPRVVYLDEPTIGLDLTAQRAIRDFLLRYREEHRPAMLLTSHYMEDIERLCQRIIILRAGEIVYDGSLSGVAEVYSAHKIVCAHLRKSDGELPRPDSWSAYGEIVRCEPHEVRLRVPRQQVAAAAAALLAALPVADLSIEEVDIATVIEELIRERQK
ncbi:MAG: ATP-binding cassette domain-containing protein [Planctomycetota bacterium]